jgi:hypothetical protein
MREPSGYAAGFSSGTHPAALARYILCSAVGEPFTCGEVLHPMAAAGYALLYLLFGGGLGGAIIIFIVAKMFGK